MISFLESALLPSWHLLAGKFTTVRTANKLFLRSSAVESSTVNGVVVGSIPTAGAIIFALVLSACSPGQIARGLLGAATGGGGGISAQVGKENESNRGVNIRHITEAPTVTVRPKGRIDNLNQSTTNNLEGVPLEWWLVTILVAFIMLWLDSPKRWPGQLYRLFKRGN